MMRESTSRERAIEAYRILNEFVGDLVAGTRTLEIFESPGFTSQIQESTLVTLRRMCLSHLVITMSKWAELYDHYKAVIPADAKTACRDLRKETDRRGIRSFRNSVVGHIWDSKLKRPLTTAEIDSRLAVVLGASQASFLAWINNPAANRFPDTVVSICEQTRNRIGEANGITASELFPS